MGQLSAELNYERRLERYEEEVEKDILNSEDWEEELEHYLEEAMGEEQEEELEGEGQREEGHEEYGEGHEEYGVMLVPSDLTEEEKSEGEVLVRKEREASGSAVLLERPGEAGDYYEELLFPALEMGGYLRDLVVEGIEVPIEPIELEPDWTEEDIERALELEEKRQEELAREALFEETFRWIIEEERKGPLERLFEVKTVKEYELDEELERPMEELREEFEESAGEKLEEFVEESVEELEGEYEELTGLEKLEKLEELVEEVGKEQAEELAEEIAEEAEEEHVEELETVEGEEVGLVEEVKEEGEEIEEGLAEELVERVEGEEEVEGAEEVAEEAGEVEEVGGVAEELVEEAAEEKAEEVAEGGGPPERPEEEAAAGEEGPHRFTVDWYELPDGVALRVDKGKLQELIREARGKAGGANALRSIIHERTQVDILKGKQDVVWVRKLKELLDFLGIPYNEMDAYIKGIGSQKYPDVISKPRLSFNFNSKEGAIVLAAALKDGHINRRLFNYTNKDRGNIERVEEAVRKVFGDVKPYVVELRGAREITYYSSAIATALMKMGAPAGRKTEQRYHVPKVVLEGDKEVKRAYLYQTMMDEGYWNPERHYISYEQVSSLSIEGLPREEREYLDRLLTKRGEFPQGGVYRFVLVNEELKDEIKREHPSLWEAIEKSKPPYLEKEVDMLEEVCGVRPELRAEKIYVTRGEKYRIMWEVGVYNKRDFEKIMKWLGLPKEKHSRERD